MHKQHRKHTYHEERKKAQQHFNRVAREINCEIPKPKVVHVQLDPSKSYVPSCTILHRCGDDTGCCKNTKTCQPIQKENVDLYFTVTVGIFKFSFVILFWNFTSCFLTYKLDFSFISLKLVLSDFEVHSRRHDTCRLVVSILCPFAITSNFRNWMESSF